MPPTKKKSPSVLVKLNNCTACGFKLIAMPPCPKCGSEIVSFMTPQEYQEIIDFLTKFKGSTCRIFLGKEGGDKMGEPILMYELLKKIKVGG